MTTPSDGLELGAEALRRAAATPVAAPLASPRSLGHRADASQAAPTLADTTVARHQASGSAPAEPAGPLQALMESFPDASAGPTFAYVRRRRPSRVPPPPDPRGGVPGLQRSMPDTGTTLTPTQRAEFEELVGGPLPEVRLHTGAEARAAAASISADAFASGSDISFGKGQFDPVNPAGRALLAHELTHVRQQADGTPQAQRTPMPAEGEAEALAVERQVRRGEAAGSEALVIDRVVRRYSTRGQPVGKELAERLDGLAERALQQAKASLAPQLARSGNRDISRVSVPLTASSTTSDEQVIAAWTASIAAAIRSTLTS